MISPCGDCGVDTKAPRAALAEQHVNIMVNPQTPQDPHPRPDTPNSTELFGLNRPKRPKRCQTRSRLEEMSPSESTELVESFSNALCGAARDRPSGSTVAMFDAYLWHDIATYLPLLDALRLGTLLKHWSRIRSAISIYRNAVRRRMPVLDFRQIRRGSIQQFLVDYIQNEDGTENDLTGVTRLILPSCSWMPDSCVQGVILACAKLSHLQVPSCGPWRVHHHGDSLLFGSYVREKERRPGLVLEADSAPSFQRWKSLEGQLWRRIGNFCTALRGVHLEECSHLSNADLFMLFGTVSSLRTLVLPRPNSVTKAAYEQLPKKLEALHVNLGSGESGPLSGIHNWPVMLQHARLQNVASVDVCNLLNRCEDLQVLEVDNTQVDRAGYCEIDMTQLVQKLRMVRLRHVALQRLTDSFNSLFMGFVSTVQALEIEDCSGVVSDESSIDELKKLSSLAFESCPKLVSLRLSTSSGLSLWVWSRPPPAEESQDGSTIVPQLQTDYGMIPPESVVADFFN